MSGLISGLGARLALGSGAALVGTSQNAPVAVPYLQTLSDINNGRRISLARFVAPANLVAIRSGSYAGDTTAALTAAVNSGALGIFVPSGRWNFTAFTMPVLAGFTLAGEGPASVLVQKGAGITYPVRATTCLDAHQTIKDLGFDGTAGTGNTLDTTYAQTIDLLNLSFNNIPATLSALKMDGNPTDGTYAHDMRAKNIRIYSTTTANAGIVLGAHHSDSTIDGFIMNGNYTTNYCLLALNGAQTTVVSNSHPYNAKVNVVNLQGNNNNFGWAACTFDSAQQDTFYQSGSTNGRFSNCYFEDTANGKKAIVFDNSYNNSLFGTSFHSPGGAAACVQELNGASGNKIIGGQIDNAANWTALFNLAGDGSYAKGFQGYGKDDSVYSLVGTAQTPQAQNTTLQYGANGSGNLTNTGWAVPLVGKVLAATVFTDQTPAAGGTFLFNLQVNGTTIATGTITNGQYSTTFKPSPAYAVNAGDQVSIQGIFSTTSGSASPRYAVTMEG